MRITTVAAAAAVALLGGTAVTQTTHASSHRSHSSHHQGANGASSSHNGSPGTDSTGGNDIGKGLGDGTLQNNGNNDQNNFVNLFCGGSSFQGDSILQNIGLVVDRMPLPVPAVPSLLPPPSQLCRVAEGLPPIPTGLP